MLKAEQDRCLSRKTGLAMAFKLMMSAQKKWRKLDGQNRLPEIIQGVEFCFGSDARWIVADEDQHFRHGQG